MVNQPSLFQRLQGAVQGARSAVARAGITRTPTMQAPFSTQATHGHANPNDHFANTGANPGGGAPVNTFAPFLESHIRQVAPPRFTPRA